MPLGKGLNPMDIIGRPHSSLWLGGKTQALESYRWIVVQILTLPLSSSLALGRLSCSLNLSFLLCKMTVMLSSLRSGFEDSVKSCLKSTCSVL